MKSFFLKSIWLGVTLGSVVVSAESIRPQSLDPKRWQGEAGVDIRGVDENTLQDLFKKKDRAAEFVIGKRLKKEGEVQEGLDLLTDSAARGFIPAQLELGLHYLQTKSDPAKAVQYLTLASVDDPLAQYQLGRLYYEGRYVSQDIPKAIALLNSADQGGFYPALIILGTIYRDGVGANRDEVKALQIFEKAAKAGYDKATFHVAESYRYGRGVTQDIPRAIALYKSIPTFPYSKIALGKLYLTDEYKNPAEAFVCFQAAFDQNIAGAEQDKVIAAHQLGLLYWQGLGTEKNLGEADRYLQRGANGNNTAGQIDYARFLQEQKHPVDAYGWAYLASRLGNTDANPLLTSLEKELTPEQIEAAKKQSQQYASNVLAWITQSNTDWKNATRFTGLILYYGLDGHPPRQEEGLAALRVAAQINDPVAQQILGELSQDAEKSGWKEKAKSQPKDAANYYLK